ncbi:uncharacterized protein LOC116607137 isoform X3 [Nematostella vectensis]|uniref:uncharacterized protein LOC116607137 isoform X3 n=1 Tax=Nematostella vectensis TaxID=45351 RepID=UPI0020772FFA|nr:uncharacterized protein LOC116607137 isoform X3 [Nematostella vectensis]
MEFQCYIKTSGSLFFLLVNSYNNKGTDTKVMHYGHGIIIRFTGGKPQKSLTAFSWCPQYSSYAVSKSIYPMCLALPTSGFSRRRLAWWTRKKY